MKGLRKENWFQRNGRRKDHKDKPPIFLYKIKHILKLN